MSDYTGREMDIMYREAFEAGQERGHADMAHIVAERDQLSEDRRELMKALEELTATCESNHRIAQIGWSYDKYEFAYEAQVSNPVKRARTTIDRIKAREGKGE